MVRISIIVLKVYRQLLLYRERTLLSYRLLPRVDSTVVDSLPGPRTRAQPLVHLNCAGGFLRYLPEQALCITLHESNCPQKWEWRMVPCTSGLLGKQLGVVEAGVWCVELFMYFGFLEIE